jgi:DNA polymerase-3 subunit gamma/tau
VHQLSSHSFNALLKSIEEPPPHVVFMMATTELEKIPETVLSRSQVYEFRTIPTQMIVEQLRRIADSEGIGISDAALQLVARDAEGSMRDAQSKLDQVLAFTGTSVGDDDVAAVLGVVGRDLVFDAVEAVAREDASAAFVLAARAAESGSDLRLVCRELSRVVRDLLVLSVDPSRISDPEIATEGERERMTALARPFSREDLLRAFDLLTKAEYDIRVAAQPRYHLEMVLLRWIYLRKIVPIEDLLTGAAPRPASSSQPSGAPAAARSPGGATSASPRSVAPNRPPPVRPEPAEESQPVPADGPPSSGPRDVKDAVLAEVRRSKGAFYNTVVTQALRIDLAPGRLTFVFAAGQRALRDLFEQHRGWLESVAQTAAGRRMSVVSVQDDEPAAAGAPPTTTPVPDRQAALKERVLADAGVQALLEVFPAEIRDVEEI